MYIYYIYIVYIVYIYINNIVMISNGIPNNKHQLGLGCGIGFSSLLLFQLSRLLHRKNGMYLQLSEDSRIYGNFNHKKHMVIQ
jgi:hypothetical protein